MLETIAKLIESSMHGFSPVIYPLVLVGGALTGANPCVYPTIPVIISLVGGEIQTSKLRGLLLSLTFVVGLAATYVLLGLFASFIGGILGLSTKIWYYIVAGICILVGLNLAGIFTLKFRAFSPFQSRFSAYGGFIGAFMLGMLFGIVASPCATPILAAIIAYVAAKGSTIYGGSLLFTYAIGHGIPVIIIGTFTGAIKSFSKFARYTPFIQKISGWLLVGIGGYLVWLASIKL